MHQRILSDSRYILLLLMYESDYSLQMYFLYPIIVLKDNPNWFPFFPAQSHSILQNTVLPPAAYNNHLPSRIHSTRKNRWVHSGSAARADRTYSKKLLLHNIQTHRKPPSAYLSNLPFPHFPLLLSAANIPAPSAGIMQPE